MENKTIKFKAPPPRSTGLVISTGIILPASIIVFVSIFSFKNEMQTFGQLILWGFVLIMMFCGIVIFIYNSSTFWRYAYFVDLTEDILIAYNIWKQPRYLKYEDIVIIKKIRWNNCMLLITPKQEKVIIAANIDHYGQCIEEIRKRAKNVKEVDYGGLNKNQSIWNSHWGYENKLQELDRKLFKKEKDQEIEADLTIVNYCTNCNRLEENYKYGKCSVCGNELTTIC